MRIIALALLLLAGCVDDKRCEFQMQDGGTVSDRRCLATGRYVRCDNANYSLHAIKSWTCR